MVKKISDKKVLASIKSITKIKLEPDEILVIQVPKESEGKLMDRVGEVFRENLPGRTVLVENIGLKYKAIKNTQPKKEE